MLVLQLDDNKELNEISQIAYYGIKRINFFNGNVNYTKLHYDEIEKLNRNEFCIPIGSLQFVNMFTKIHYDFKIPIITYDHKFCDIVKEVKLLDVKQINNFPYFIKSKELKKGNGEVITKYKDLHYYLEINNTLKDTDIMYYNPIIRDYISEWRIYIKENKILKVCNYMGNPTLFPVNFVNHIVSNYDIKPIAYSIDIGFDSISELWNIIEVNDFYSLGNYGLNELDYLDCTTSRYHQIYFENKLIK
jgi:hypothetical protein